MLTRDFVSPAALVVLGAYLALPTASRGVLSVVPVTASQF